MHSFEKKSGMYRIVLDGKRDRSFRFDMNSLLRLRSQISQGDQVVVLKNVAVVSRINLNQYLLLLMKLLGFTAWERRI